MPHPPEYIAGLRLLHGNGMPIWELLRNGEMRRGNYAVLPGQRPWLSPDDWDMSTVASIDGLEVRLIVLVPRLKTKPGILKRLIGGIIEAKLIPTLVCPDVGMLAFCRKRGWTYTVRGAPPLTEDIWRPPEDEIRP